VPFGFKGLYTNVCIFFYAKVSATKKRTLKGKKFVLRKTYILETYSLSF